MQERGNLSNVDSLAVRRSLAVHGVVAKKRRSKDGCRQHESCRSEGTGSSVADSGVESESGESSPGERASEVKEGEWGGKGRPSFVFEFDADLGQVLSSAVSLFRRCTSEGRWSSGGMRL